MAEIRINLERAKRQARQLDEAASELRSELKKIASAKQAIPSYWEGAAARTFTQKLNEQYNELSQLCKQMESVADSIRTVAESIKRQEEAAQRAAKNL